MPKPNHKYRVSVYLGKEMFNELDQLASLLNVSVSTITRVLISTGYEISKSIEGGLKNGKQQPKI